VKVQEDIAPELKEFIDQLIVPLLVEKVKSETEHLYSEAVARYDTEVPCSQAA
jgi:hypothetical protein